MPENGPEVRGWIKYVAADETAANEFIDGVKALALENGVISEDFVESSLSDPEGQASAHTSEALFTWAKEYADSEEHIAVITRDNVAAFEGGGGDTPKAKTNRSSRFFNGIMRRSISSTDMEDGGYATFAIPDKQDHAVASIRVIRSLELLRKLKTDQIGSRKTDGTIGLKGLSRVGIEFFERYCEALFPDTDVSQASRELDADNVEHMLKRSSRRRRIWSWVGQQSVGAVFFGKDAAHGAGILEDQSKIGLLIELGLISRFPAYPGTRINRDMKYHGVPCIKLHDDRWDVINELLAKTA